MSAPLADNPAIRSLSHQMLGGEPAFAEKDVAKVLEICTTNEIAVLGVEIFEPRGDGYYAKGFSTYDQQKDLRRAVSSQQWHQFVLENNTLADEFIRSLSLASNDLLVLTTSSWAEFCEDHQIRG